MTKLNENLSGESYVDSLIWMGDLGELNKHTAELQNMPKKHKDNQEYTVLI
jgi:hypothetical protein